MPKILLFRNQCLTEEHTEVSGSGAAVGRPVWRAGL